jgi:prepilin-type processing-associated H-X9-DG protein
MFPVGAGPSSISTGDSGYSWATDNAPNGSGMTGISYMRSQVTQAAITDGPSNTYFAGERYLDPNHYEDGADPADQLCALAGWSYDLYRDCQGGKSPWQDNLNGPPSTAAPNSATTAFGSAHPGALNMVFCDGSVHSISYSIDQETNRRLANRADNLPVDASKAGF